MLLMNRFKRHRFASSSPLLSFMPRRPLLIAASQHAVRWCCRMVLTLAYRVRVHGLDNYPQHDGFLICANHQSYLDPVVMGVVCPRPINYLGRQSLFRFRLLGWFLKWNDTIPIDRDGSGIGGLKETLRRLKRRESVLIFPEGTRSPDGELQSIKPGFITIARRAQVDLLPVAIDGAYQAMPRSRWWPSLGSIVAVIGEPIQYADYAQLSDDQLMALLESRLQAAFRQARQRRRHAQVAHDSSRRTTM